MNRNPPDPSHIPGSDTKASLAAARSSRDITAAVVGNPNCGKTAIFNHLTGSTHTVANYPGVTVERKTGRRRCGEATITFVDLPGTYSMTAYSLDELVARDFVLQSRPHVIVDIVDASNLERNLYLTVQLMEMRLPMVIVLNMMDIAERRGIEIDARRLSDLLGVPVVQAVGTTGQGVADIASAVLDTAVADVGESAEVHAVTYGHKVEQEVEKLACLLRQDAALVARYPERWLAVKLIEQDQHALGEVRASSSSPKDIERAARAAIQAIESHFNDDAEALVAERRYGFAAGIVRDCVRQAGKPQRRWTDRIDAVVCHRLLGPLILLAVVYSLFFAVFQIADEQPWLFGRSPTQWVTWFFDDVLTSLVAPISASLPMMHSLLVDGVIGGVGGVLSFVPIIIVMFIFVAMLEDSGYIARIAFVLDRVLRPFGLQGKSILAMLISGGIGGGGCAVPGVMATRTLRDEHDRLLTMLVAPLMNCGAKMPVYLMLIAAFFPSHKALALFVLWATSWCVALAAAFVLRTFVIRGEQTPFVMELPAYHRPTLRGVFIHTWERTWLYVRKAGTVILAVSLILWALMYFPRLDARTVDTMRAAENTEQQMAQAQLQHSVAGRLGSRLVPVSRLAGFDWRDNIALVGGFAAKEVIIGTLGVAYAMGDVDPDASEGLAGQLASDPGWSPLGAAAMMIFVMVYAPCLSTMAVIRRESGSWKWTLFSTVYSTTLAFVLAVGIFQIGHLLGLGA